jgi:hypothetical protein
MRAMTNLSKTSNFIQTKRSLLSQDEGVSEANLKKKLLIKAMVKVGGSIVEFTRYRSLIPALRDTIFLDMVVQVNNN